MVSLPKLRSLALNLLALREHSKVELRQKLCQKGFAEALVMAVIQELAEKKLQSDQRFIESYVHMRKKRGFGPRRIQMELVDRGITKEQGVEALKNNEVNWLELAKVARTKKFGKNIPDAYRACLPQMRYLYYKGFTSEQIKQVFGHEEDL